MRQNSGSIAKNSIMNNETRLHLLFPPFSMHESGEQNPHWLGVPPLPLVPTLQTYLAVLDLFMGMHWRWLVTPMWRGKRQRRWIRPPTTLS